MKFQDYMIESTQKAADEAFRYATAVPTDKVEWKTSEDNRSVLEQARELAQCPVWAHEIISNMKWREMTPEDWAATQAEMAKLTTVAECQAKANENLAKLFELYKALPDEDLNKTAWLPFGGGRDFTVVEMMDYPRWNYNYHLGQIAFIQMMYGDKEMH